MTTGLQESMSRYRERHEIQPLNAVLGNFAGRQWISRTAPKQRKNPGYCRRPRGNPRGRVQGVRPESQESHGRTLEHGIPVTRYSPVDKRIPPVFHSMPGKTASCRSHDLYLSPAGAATRTRLTGTPCLFHRSICPDGLSCPPDTFRHPGQDRPGPLPPCHCYSWLLHAGI